VVWFVPVVVQLPRVEALFFTGRGTAVTPYLEMPPLPLFGIFHLMVT